MRCYLQPIWFFDNTSILTEKGTPSKNWTCIHSFEDCYSIPLSYRSMVSHVGIKPTTPPLRAECSIAELMALGESRGLCSPHTSVKSRMLYWMSYRPIWLPCLGLNQNSWIQGPPSCQLDDSAKDWLGAYPCVFILVRRFPLILTTAEFANPVPPQGIEPWFSR